MRVLVDTDVILDFLLNRQPFYANAKAIWQANIDGKFEGYISATSPVNAFYFVRKVTDIPSARQSISQLLSVWQILTLNADVLRSALTLNISDYEDAVQHESASRAQLDGIVTRNVEDFKYATLPIYAPAQFLAQLEA
jgi:predicted nucleic acid-binding protein